MTANNYTFNSTIAVPIKAAARKIVIRIHTAISLQITFAICSYSLLYLLYLAIFSYFSYI